MKTSDETLNEISSELLGDVPEKLSPYELSRYIYIKLGQNFSYDEDYYINHNEEEKNKILDKNIEDVWKEYKKEKKEDPNTNPKAICTQFAELYAELLEKYKDHTTQNFKTSYERKNGEYGPHAFVDITIDGKKYRTDLTRDLQHIKSGLSIDNFMSNPKDEEKYGNKYENIENQDEIFSTIDQETGYTKAKEKTDKIVTELKEKSNQDADIKSILEEQIKYLQENSPSFITHSREKANYFLELLKSSATKEEGLRFNFSDPLACVDKTLPSGKGKNVKSYISFTDNNSGKKFILTFTDKEYAKEISQESLREEIKNGHIKTISSEKKKLDLLNEIAGITISETINDDYTKEKKIISAEKIKLNSNDNNIKSIENLDEKNPSNICEKNK